MVTVFIIDFKDMRGRLISLWLYKENKLWDWKNIYTLHIPPDLHTRLHCSNFFNPSSKILLVVLQIGKAKDLAAPLHIIITDNNIYEAPSLYSDLRDC
jgi:hypothetical protein